MFDNINSLQELVKMPQWREENPLRVASGFTYLGNKFMEENGLKHVKFSTADGALEAAPVVRDSVYFKKALYKAIQQLRAIGGSGILISPLTYIFDEETPRWRRLLSELGLWRKY